MRCVERGSEARRHNNERRSGEKKQFSWPVLTGRATVAAETSTSTQQAAIVSDVSDSVTRLTLACLTQKKPKTNKKKKKKKAGEPGASSPEERQPSARVAAGRGGGGKKVCCFFFFV